MNIEDELSRKKHELSMAEKRIRDLQESIEQGMGTSSDDDTFNDDIGESDDSLTSSFRKRRSSSSFRQKKYSLTKKYSSDSFDSSFTSATTSYRPHRGLSHEDSYISANGLLGKDSIRTALVSERRNSGISRTGSRTASRTLTRQNSND